MDVIINENQINVPVEISTWGDLLDWVETDYLRAGQCITHVYLGGNEALNYRDSLVCGKEITDVGLVAIRSGDFDRVVRDSMAELDQELQSSIDSVDKKLPELSAGDIKDKIAELNDVLVKYAKQLELQVDKEVDAETDRLLRERFRALVELENGNHCGPPRHGPAEGALLEAYRAAGLEIRLLK